MRISISNNTSSQVSCDVATVQPGGKIIVTVEDDKLDNVLSELQKLGTNITYRLLDQVVSQRQITSPLTLYVSTGGDDSNSGTIRDPFRTIQAALDSLKGVEIAAPVTIQVGAGEFDGFIVGGLRFYGLGSLKILGSSSVLESSTLTSSANEGNGFLIITDSNKSWTTDEWKGKYVKYSAGVFPISTNTATTLKVMTTATSVVGAYEIVEPSTIIKDAVSPIVGGTTIQILPNDGQSLASQVTVEMVSVQTTSTGVVRIRHGGIATLLNVTNNRGVSLAGGSVEITRCVIIGTAGISTGSNLPSSLVSAISCLIENTTAWCIHHENGIIRVGACVLNSAVGTTAIHLSGPTAVLLATGTNNVPIEINNSNVGIRAQRGAVATVSGQTTTSVGLNLRGSGNTTAIMANTGGRVAVASVANITGTTEISVDGATSTLAAMRALTPQGLPGHTQPIR